MTSRQFEPIETFLSNEQFAAGNFIRQLHDCMSPEQREAQLIELDEPVVLGRDSVDRLSVGDIKTIADSYAVAYQRMGVGLKDPVVLYFEDNLQYFIQYVALTSIGAIPVFVNSLLEPTIFGLFVDKVGARWLVADSHRVRLLEGTLATNGRNQDLSLLDVNAIPLPSGKVKPKVYEHGPDETVLIAHTSGTTGVPKAVQFTHKALCFGIKRQIKHIHVKRVLSALPHSHGAALSILMSSLLHQAKVRIQVRKSAPELLQAIETFKPDFVCAFPKVFVDLCRHDLGKYDLSSIQNWLATGDANHEPHIRKLIAQGHHLKDGKSVPGSCFIDNLGSSEFAFSIFRSTHNVDSNTYNRCIGKPFDWVTAVVLSEDGKELGAHQVGRLGVTSPSVTKGYWNDSFLTERNTLAGYWLTGDLVFRDDDGVFYHVDRTTDSIPTKSGTLYSCQSEEWLLRNLPELFEISIVGVDNNAGETEVVAMVEFLATSGPIDRKLLKAKINNLLQERGWPLISRLEEQSANEEVGVTGKKLKRRLRASGAAVNPASPS